MEKREHWGGRLAFVLAAAGSAVGLGNVWKFPFVAGENGGAAFVLVYLVCILLIGMPIMIAELLIGRTTQKSPVSAFRKLGSGRWWPVGAIGVFCGFLILSYYSVIAGWTLEYTLRSFTGDYRQITEEADFDRLRPAWIQQAITRGVLPAGTRELVEEQEHLFRNQAQGAAIDAAFGEFVGDWRRPMFWHLAFMGLCILVVLGGVKGGIEAVSKVLMPVLVLVMIGIAVRGLMIPGSWAGVEFLCYPHFERLSAASVLEALGQAFFTLSLGMGAMLTYGSYLSEESNLYKSAGLVVLADTGIALLAGLAVYPAVFAYGVAPNDGPGLIFKSLPVVFDQMPGGYLVGGLFFVALTIAALTSAISLLEVVVAYMMDDRGWERRTATVAAGALIALLGVPSVLGCVSGETSVLGLAEHTWSYAGQEMAFLDIADWLASNLLLPLGGLLMAVFVGFFWSREEALEALSRGDEGLTARFGKVWLFLCGWLAPILVALVLLNSLKFF